MVLAIAIVIEVGATEIRPDHQHNAVRKPQLFRIIPEEPHRISKMREQRLTHRIMDVMGIEATQRQIRRGAEARLEYQ